MADPRVKELVYAVNGIDCCVTWVRMIETPTNTESTILSCSTLLVLFHIVVLYDILLPLACSTADPLVNELG